MYRALYRKWRPQTFEQVVGQETITTALSNQILAGRVGHAYLFTGTRGTGKTTCAKIFAKAVNCENPNGANPCGECVPCRGLEDGSILDVIEIDAASNNSVDDIRDLRDETAYRPSRCRYKVYIIDEVHMLSTSAFNALLKIMEEPPSHVIFILATTEIHKVPATILSRCQRYDFTRIPAEKMAARLMEVAAAEEISLTPGAADLIARLADGALRDALSLLDTCSGVGEAVDEQLVRRMAGVADRGYLFALSDAVAEGDVQKLLQLVASLRDKSIDVKRLTEELVHHYRHFLLLSAQTDGALLKALPEEEQKRYLDAAADVDAGFAIGAIRRLAGAMDKMGRSPDPRVELELALFDLCLPPEPAQAAGQPAARTAAVTTTSSPTAMAAQAPPAPATPGPAAAAAPDDDAPPFDMPPATPKPMAAAPSPVADTPAKPAAERATEPEETVPVIPAVAPATGEGPVPFGPWPQVVKEMAAINRMLYSYMKGSEAYFDGRRVLIDGGDMFLSYMRDYAEAAEELKRVIEKICGARYGIGPYVAPSAKPEAKPVTAQDTLREWEQKGVPIEYK